MMTREKERFVIIGVLQNVGFYLGREISADEFTHSTHIQPWASLGTAFYFMAKLLLFLSKQLCGTKVPRSTVGTLLKGTSKCKAWIHNSDG